MDLAGYGAQSTLGAASTRAPAAGEVDVGGRAGIGIDTIGMADLEILDFPPASQTPAKPLVFELQTTTTDSPTNEEVEGSQVKDKDEDAVEDDDAYDPQSQLGELQQRLENC